ncbi:MAG TPA: ferrous iron transport protein B [Candidatus Acidoferrum sp.]|jgi:ferrous iron transport protein B|nr:ferrous iron transport protein B [Candidatus Acidoferrum sp.]
MAHDFSTFSSKKTLNNEGRNLTFALAGNANVGKSVVFNQLTGSSQVIGNWPGKTVERAQGVLNFEGRKITVVDLPGIYSFSTYSLEEIVSREYIAFENPDVVINVVDSSVLERNLFFTIQLIEMGVPLVLCLNQVDAAKKSGITIDVKKLEHVLGIPVVPTVAIRGEGIYELAETAIKVAQNSHKAEENVVRYGAEIEERIEKLVQAIKSQSLTLNYPPRWVAIKLLENDPEIKKTVSSKSQSGVHEAEFLETHGRRRWRRRMGQRTRNLVDEAELLADEIAQIHKEPCFAVLASERYSLANKIAASVQQQSEVKSSFSERLDSITTHRVVGYVTSAGVITGLLLWTFAIGGLLSALLSDALGFLAPVNPSFNGSIVGILWNGVFGGLVAGITLVIPYVIPFYVMLAMIEDSGILTRVAFMMDSAMHKIGLHGKALIPLILGYGCNVPAIRGCRIMETRRERLLAAFAITFAPCAARTILILGLVAAFVSAWWALALYAVDIAIIFVLGRIALRMVPGQSAGLIMEMHSFKTPSWSVVGRQTWGRTKSLIYIVFPTYIVGSALVQVLYAVGVLGPVSNVLSPLTVWWLGLPAIAGILLVLGTVRKEFILLGSVAVFGSANLALFMTPVQLITLALVGILYLPCLSTIGVLVKEFGWKAAATISAANFVTAIIVGGVAFRLLSLIL